MSQKSRGMVVAAIGLLIALVAALAGVIGLGDAAFGPYQIAGTAAGGMVLVLGLVLYRRTGA